MCGSVACHQFENLSVTGLEKRQFNLLSVEDMEISPPCKWSGVVRSS